MQLAILVEIQCFYCNYLIKVKTGPSENQVERFDKSPRSRAWLSQDWLCCLLYNHGQDTISSSLTLHGLNVDTLETYTSFSKVVKRFKEDKFWKCLKKDLPERVPAHSNQMLPPLKQLKTLPHFFPKKKNGWLTKNWHKQLAVSTKPQLYFSNILTIKTRNWWQGILGVKREQDW